MLLSKITHVRLRPSKLRPFRWIPGAGTSRRRARPGGTDAGAGYRKVAITAFQSGRKRSLSSKWMLIQNCRAPAPAAAPIFATHSSTGPAIANRSAR